MLVGVVNLSVLGAAFALGYIVGGILATGAIILIGFSLYKKGKIVFL